MAISLGFGVLFSSVVVLVQTLATHMILYDLRNLHTSLVGEDRHRRVREATRTHSPAGPL